MAGNQAIELVARELRAAVGELIDRPAADVVHPLARRDRLCARGEQIERLPPRVDAVEADFVRPRRAGAQQVHVVVDETRNDRAAPQIDAARRGSGHLQDLLITADEDEAIAFDGDRLRDRELVVDGDDLAVGEDEIGWRWLCASDDTGADQRRDHRGCAKSPHRRSLCEGAPL